MQPGRLRPAKFKWELALLVLFLATQIAMDFRLETHLERDSHHYLELAQRLLNEARFAYKAPDGKVMPDLARTPVYPVITAAILSLCGGKTTLAIPILIWMQRLAWGLAVCFCLPRITAANGRRRNYCLLGKTILLFSPLTMLYGSLLLTDLGYAAGLLVGITIFNKAIRRNSIPRAIAAGIAHGLLILLRPVHLFAPLALVLPWLRPRFPVSALILLISLTAPALWIMRNHAVADAWVFSSITGRGLALHQLPVLKTMPVPPDADDHTIDYLLGIQAREGTPFTASWTLMHTFSLPETRVDAIARNLALQSIAHSPASFITESLHNIRRMIWSPAEGQALARQLSPAPSRRFETVLGIISAAVTALFVFFIPAALIIRMPSRLRRSRTAVSYALLALYLIIVPALTTVTYGRFALPLLPIVGIIYCYSNTGSRPRNHPENVWQEKS